jgi:hypothetical protein
MLEAKDLGVAARRSKEEEIKAMQLERGGKFAARRETAFVTDNSLGDPISILETDPGYTKLCQRFVKEGKELIEKQPANVLDLFCGIGTGLVALKRLGININQVLLLLCLRLARPSTHSHQAVLQFCVLSIILWIMITQRVVYSSRTTAATTALRLRLTLSTMLSTVTSKLLRAT